MKNKMPTNNENKAIKVTVDTHILKKMKIPNKKIKSSNVKMMSAVWTSKVVLSEERIL